MANLATKWTCSDSLGGTVVVSDDTDVPVCRIPAYRDDKKRLGDRIAANPEILEALVGILRSVEADKDGVPSDRAIRDAEAAVCRAGGFRP